MRYLSFAILAALAAPIAFVLAHLDRTGPTAGARFRQIVSGFAGELGDLTLVTSGAVEELEAKERDLLSKAREIAEAAEKSELGDFTLEQRAEVKRLVEEAKDTRKKAAEAKGDAALLAYIAEQDAGLAVNQPGPKSTSKGSLGDRFVKDGAIDEYLKRITSSGGGYIGEKTRIQSDAVHFAGFKDILSSGDHEVGAGTLVGPDFRGLLDLGVWQRPLTIRDLVSHGTTTSDAVSYARMLGVVNNAEAVPEATGTSAGDASGDVTGAKPESGIELEPVTESVKTIAHWIPMTKRALSDASQIRTLIDTFLRYGLEEELEDQMVGGDGNGENFEGILTVSGTQPQSFDTDIIKTLRKAKTLAQVGGRGRDLSVVLSPVADETVDLIQDQNDNYIGGGPFRAQDSTIWGMRRVVSEAVPDDTAIVGDFRWAMLWDREQAAVQLSDSHADFFTRNLVAALAELRAAFGVIRPAAFVITATE